MTKKLVALLLTGCMVLSMAACGGKGSAPDSGGQINAGTTESSGNASTDAGAPKTGKETGTEDGGEGAVKTNYFGTTYVDELNTEKSEETLTIAIGSEPDQLLTLNGLTENDIAMIDGYILDRLVNFDEKTKEIVPGLATAWEQLDDKHIKFSLRDDVLMVDGNKMTADDVLYTMQYAVEHAGKQDVGRYYDLEECSVVDEHTIIIGTNVVAPGFLQLLTYTPFGIISKTAVETAGGDDALTRNPVVGCGKYIFEKWEKGQYIQLVRNDQYWDDSYAGYYKYIRFIFINDNAARVMAVESGDADVAIDVPVAVAYPQVGNANLSVNFYDTARVANVYLNTSRGVFADKAVREAVYWALDREAINQVSTAGLGVISNAFVPADNPYYTNVYEEAPKMDVEKAKQILADAGYTGTLEATAMVQQAQQPVMTVIQENLRAIGINLEIASTDSGSYIARAKEGDYDLLYGQLDVEARLPQLFSPLYGPQVESGVIGGPKYVDSALDEAIKTARSTFDEDEAKEAIKTVLTIAKDEVLAIGINTQITAVVTGSSVDGLQIWPKKYVNCTQVRPAK